MTTKNQSSRNANQSFRSFELLARTSLGRLCLGWLSKNHPPTDLGDHLRTASANTEALGLAELPPGRRGAAAASTGGGARVDSTGGRGGRRVRGGWLVFGRRERYKSRLLMKNILEHPMKRCHHPRSGRVLAIWNNSYMFFIGTSYKS